MSMRSARSVCSSPTTSTRSRRIPSVASRFKAASSRTSNPLRFSASPLRRKPCAYAAGMTQQRSPARPPRPWSTISRLPRAARSLKLFLTPPESNWKPRSVGRSKGMSKSEKNVTDQATILEAIRKSGTGKVKVAVSDIDGVLRGKYIHTDKFFSAVESGFGFCDVVFGWDVGDQPYDNAYMTGWHHGFPDAMVRLDLATYRNVPWDGGVPFFLGNFVNADGTPHPLCPRQLLKRVLAGRERMGFTVMVGAEYEFFNFAETPQSWAAKNGASPTPISQGMFGYSLLRANANREYFNALMDEMARFRVPLEGLHTETGPGVYEAAIVFSDALEAGDRAILFKTGAKEIGARFGIMPSFMAKWNP